MHSQKRYQSTIELMINKLHGLSPSGGLVSPSGGFASLLFDQVEYFASIKLCQALSRQGAIIKISVVRCHYLLCLGAQLSRGQSCTFDMQGYFEQWLWSYGFFSNNKLWKIWSSCPFCQPSRLY